MDAWACAVVWILAALVILMNLMTVLAYACPALHAMARTDPARAPMLYLVSRSSALVVAAIVGMVAVMLGHGTGWLLGVALASAVVQGIDVFIAAKAGEKRTRRITVVLAATACAVQVVLIVLVLTLTS